MIGSSNTGLALRPASRKPDLAQSSKLLAHVGVPYLCLMLKLKSNTPPFGVITLPLQVFPIYVWCSFWQHPHRRSVLSPTASKPKQNTALL
jgi:hypothetical protein